LLERLGWANSALIDATVASDEVERGRPHPDMIQHLMFKLGITDPQRTAKVGDTPVDLLEGRNAGCGLVFGVTGGSSTREQLEKFPHDHLINSVSQFKTMQRRWEKRSISSKCSIPHFPSQDAWDKNYASDNLTDSIDWIYC
jgi:phosphoglycolate phosphatase-like HAD superfamily hydrolase